MHQSNLQLLLVGWHCVYARALSVLEQLGRSSECEYRNKKINSLLMSLLVCLFAYTFGSFRSSLM